MGCFQDKCITELNPGLFNDVNDYMAIFSSALFDITADNIPNLKTSPFSKQKAEPWSDEQNKAHRMAKKYPNAANSIRGRPMQARAKVIKRKRSLTPGNFIYTVGHG